MKGININCSAEDFVTWILEGRKTVETRRTPSLRPYVGKRVGIIRTGCGRAMLEGYMTIVGEVHYTSVEEFRADENRHLVREGSPFDISGSKYGYIIADVERIEPVEVFTHGIIAREI